MACTINNPYKAIGYCPGTTVKPGIKGNVYFIPRRDVSAFPTAQPKSGKYSAGTSSSPAFTLVEGKKWYTIAGMRKQGNGKFEVQGEKPCVTFNNQLSVFIPGTDEDTIGFVNMAVNDDLIFAYVENDGTVRVLGSDTDEVTVTPSGDTGTASTDKKGVTLAVACEMEYAPLALAGGIDDLGTIAEYGEE